MMFLLELFIASSLITISFESKIDATLKLDEYNSKTCQGSLLLNTKFEMTGQVNFEGISKDDESHLNIEWKEANTHEFKIYDTLFFNKCTASKIFYCMQVENTNKYTIKLTVTAEMVLSQSQWMLQGSYNGIDFKSNIFSLPNVINPSHVTMKLNDELLSKELSHYEMIHDELRLCCATFHSECEAVITISSEYKVKNKECASFIPDLTKQTNYTFGYRLCNVTNYTKKYSLTLHKKSDKVLEDPGDGKIVSICVVVICFIALFFLGLFLYKKVVNKRQKNRKLIYKKSDLGNEERSTLINMEPNSTPTEETVQRADQIETYKDGLVSSTQGTKRLVKTLHHSMSLVETKRKTDVSKQNKRKTY